MNEEIRYGNAGSKRDTKGAALADAGVDTVHYWLYARTDEAVQPDNTYQMSGNRVSVSTLDLNCEFSEISGQLDKIASEHFGELKKRP